MSTHQTLRGTSRLLIGVSSLLLLASSAWSQQIQIDRGARAAGLWCFPLVTNPLEYVFIPNEARLGDDDKGNPQFSFVRYAFTKPGEPDNPATVTAAAGGEIITFLVLYETPDKVVADAQDALRKDQNNQNIILRGPIVFDSGKYALVSSIINPDTAAHERKILATGSAPVLEGNRIALSFDLQPQQATLLLKSLSMATPDVSVVFDMVFSGLTDAYDAELTVNWSEVHNSKAFSAGGTVYFVSADVQASFDELLRNNAIKLKTSGSSDVMEGLLNTVYSKLLDLLFRQVDPEQVPDDKKGGLMEALGALTDPRSGPLSSRKTTGFGLYAGFQLKEMRSEGFSVLNFNHRANVERHAFITFNVGDIYLQHGKDERYFRAFNLADPVYQQREVHVSVDGALLPDFDKYINSVSVTLHKVHESGKETLGEVIVNGESVKKPPLNFVMTYGWDGDDDRAAWLGYEYRTRWSFKGGGEYQTDWIKSTGPMIDVFAPYERRTVQLMGDPAKLKARGVRAVVVQVEYPFFAQTRKYQLVAKPDKPIEEQQIEVVQPQGQYTYSYNITWTLDGGQRLVRAGKDNSGLVFVDEIPDK